MYRAEIIHSTSGKPWATTHTAWTEDREQVQRDITQAATGYDVQPVMYDGIVTDALICSRNGIEACMVWIERDQ